MPLPTVSTALSRNRIPVVGIAGGIGSGKSAVARWVAERANVHVIDADRLGHDALMSADVKTNLRREFGDAIFGEQGEIRRGLLAQQVFGDCEEHRAARRKLEQIVHPEIGRRIAEDLERAKRAGTDAVLLDAAVLFETGWQDQCDAVVFIDTPDELRLKRVQQRSGWTAEELHRREASQWSLSEKRLRCDAAVSNDGDVAIAGEQLLNFLREHWIIGCKPSLNSSQHLTETFEICPPCL